MQEEDDLPSRVHCHIAVLDSSLEGGEREGPAQVACQRSLNNGNRPNGRGLTHHGRAHTPTLDIQAAVTCTAKVNPQGEEEGRIEGAGVTRDVLL